jgi:hypothetical protein
LEYDENEEAANRAGYMAGVKEEVEVLNVRDLDLAPEVPSKLLDRRNTRKWQP